MPNVADIDLFSRAVTEPLAEPDALAGAARPRLVFVGNLATYRIDYELLAALAHRLSPGTLVLVGVEGWGDVSRGPVARRSLLDLRNVLRVGPQPQHALPAFLRHCDVGLIPFLDNAHTRSSLPLKLWEYLSAGLPVVATDLPNFRALAEEGWVRTARGGADFAAAALECAAEPPSRRAERLERSRGHGWDERMDTLCEAVGAALASSPCASFQPDSAPL